MSAQNNGGPAFPVLARDPWKQLHTEDDKGMTLRDWFAGQAVAAILSRTDMMIKISDRPAMCATAYEIADAMLAERTKGGGS